MSKIIESDITEIVNSFGNEIKKLEGKTLLISGGAGFLGSYILATIDLLNKKKFKNKCTVICIDNFITGKKSRLDDLDLDRRYIKFINADVSKPLKITGKIDFIMHAAGIASPVYYQRYPIETIESAIFGAKHLLELARSKKIKSFLFFSSSEIYGDPDKLHIPTPETYKGNVSSTGPRSAYDESKRLGESMSMVYFRKYQVPVKIVRPFNVYGPGMYPDDNRVIPAFISGAISGKTLLVHNKGVQTRTFCYINDAIVLFIKILLSERSGEVYNVGSTSSEMTILMLAKKISKIFDNKIKIKEITYPETYPQDEPKRRKPDMRKTKKEIGYVPKISLDKGLKRVIDWYGENDFKL